MKNKYTPVPYKHLLEDLHLMKYMVVPFYGSSDKHPDYAFVRFTAATRERVRALPEVHCVRGGAVFLPLCAYEVDLVWVDHEPLAEFVKG